MSSTKSKKHKQRRHLDQIRETLEESRLPPEGRSQPGPPQREKERQSLIEQQIQEAMAKGMFDNLPGKGKPLNLNRNPYADPSLDMAHSLLQNNGFAPEWIERDKEIRRQLEAARHRLRLAWQHYQARPTQESTWQAAVARFEEGLTQLNRKIDDFNLIVPIISCQRARLRLADEVQRIQE